MNQLPYRYHRAGMVVVESRRNACGVERELFRYNFTISIYLFFLFSTSKLKQLLAFQLGNRNGLFKLPLTFASVSNIRVPRVIVQANIFASSSSISFTNLLFPFCFYFIFFNFKLSYFVYLLHWPPLQQTTRYFVRFHFVKCTRRTNGYLKLYLENICIYTRSTQTHS